MSLPRLNQGTTHAHHPEDDLNDLPDPFLKAIRVQCDLENAMELSGLTMVKICAHFHVTFPLVLQRLYLLNNPW